MTPTIFVPVLALGAALIALWIDLRFPSLAPMNLRTCFIHAAVAFVALAIVPIAVEPTFSGSQSLLAKLVALFGILFPALVYSFLSLKWLLKPLASGLLGR